MKIRLGYLHAVLKYSRMQWYSQDPLAGEQGKLPGNEFRVSTGEIDRGTKGIAKSKMAPALTPEAQAPLTKTTFCEVSRETRFPGDIPASLLLLLMCTV